MKIHKDFPKLIYYNYELLEMMQNCEIKKLLENTWLKSDRDKKRIASPCICCQSNWSSTCKNSGGFPIPDPFKIPDRWMEKHEVMAF